MPEDAEAVEKDPKPPQAAALSAVVVSYNRAALLAICLAALRFADELIVVDKSSTDGSAEIAAQFADRVVVVDWSPTVEETRDFAVSQCRHDWILCLDDDECLSPEGAAFIRRELSAPRADIYFIPQRHYVLGIHDENAYYWPERQLRLFRRDAVAFTATVHGGTICKSQRQYEIPLDGGICLHHLSYANVEQWIEKSNRYTSRPDRVRVSQDDSDLVRFAHERIDYWIGRSRGAGPGSYSSVVALLRALYDIIDRLKAWEEETGVDGESAFDRIRRTLDAAYAEHAAGSRNGPPPEDARDRVRASETAPDDPEEQTIRMLRDALRRQRDAADLARADAVRALQEGRIDAARRIQAAEAEATRIQAERTAEAERAARAEAMLAQTTDVLEQTKGMLGRTTDTLVQERRSAAAAEAAAAGEDRRLQAIVAELRQETQQSAARLAAVENSLSWRATGFLRAMIGRHSPLGRSLRRAAGKLRRS